MRQYYYFLMCCFFVSYQSPALAEECVDAVRALIPWASDWRGYPRDYPKIAQNEGLIVNSDPSGCSLDDPCILVYLPGYGYGINEEYGHVAVLYSSKAPYNIQDSNGVCGGYRKKCQKTHINWEKAKVIHPPNMCDVNRDGKINKKDALDKLKKSDFFKWFNVWKEECYEKK